MSPVLRIAGKKLIFFKSTDFIFGVFFISFFVTSLQLLQTFFISFLSDTYKQPLVLSALSSGITKFVKLFEYFFQPF